jgi:hypothetical protein
MGRVCSVKHPLVAKDIVPPRVMDTIFPSVLAAGPEKQLNHGLDTGNSATTDMREEVSLRTRTDHLHPAIY